MCKEAFHPINPLRVECKMDRDEARRLLIEWASVWAPVMSSVRASVGASVGDSVWASVMAYLGSLFHNITKWKHAEKLGPTPWKPLRELWINGLVPSYDGNTWRLHRGPKAGIFLSWNPSK